MRRGKGFRHDITERGLNYLKNTSKPGWVVIFPEGTRFSRSKEKIRQKTEEYCQNNGIHPPFENIFAPRSKGFILALNALRARLDAVYDITIAYSDSKTDSAERMDAPDMFREYKFTVKTSRPFEEEGGGIICQLKLFRNVITCGVEFPALGYLHTTLLHSSIVPSVHISILSML